MARVLVVDDERGIRNTLREFLKASGHEVFVAANVGEGRETLQAQEIDVIVLDVLLPRESGLELLRYVHDAFPEVETIMMTGEPTIETTVAAMRLGAFDFLAKPVSGNHMCDVVAQAAARKAEGEKTKRALRESEARFQRLTENAHDLIWRASLEGTFEFVNQASTSLLGRPPEEIIGEPFDLVIPKASADRLREGLIAALVDYGGNDHYRAEVDYRHRDGPIVPSEISATIVRDDVGAPIAVEGISRDITKRKRAEEALRASERLYSLALNNTTDMIFVTDPDGRVSFANEAALQHYEVGDVEDLSVLALKLWFFWCGEDIEEVKRSFAEARAACVPRSFDCRCEDNFYNLVLAPVVEEGSTRLIVCVARDITERKKAEQALRESESRYRLLAENSKDVVWTMNFDGRFVYVSPSVEVLCGFTPEEFVERTLEDLLLPQSFAGLMKHIGGDYRKLPLERHEWTRFEAKQYTKSGAVIDIEITASWFHDSQGELLGIQGTTRDITERKRAEERIRDSEERFRNIVESSPMGIVTGEAADEASLIVTSANTAAEEALGVRCVDIMGRTVEELITAPFARDIARRFRDAAVKGSRWAGDLVWTDERDEERTIEAHTFQTSPNRAAIQFIEVTERRRAEEERMRLEEQLQQAQRLESIGLLAGGIAHDMNNFLGAIMASASVLQSDFEPDSANSKDVSSILAACRRGRDLTRNLLRFSRQGDVTRERFRLSEPALATKELLERTISKRIEVQTELEPALWAIEGDRNLIGQALMNVCLNAVEAMPHGGTLTISAKNIVLDDVSCRDWTGVKPGDYVLLEVSDTGEGMVRESLDRAFEPFFTTKSLGQGAGLGLSIVYGTMRGHGGAAKLSSAMGIGSLASMLLPAIPQPVIEQTATAERVEEASTKILLVDDEALIRYAGRRILEKMGYGVVEAADGGQALDLYRELSDDIALVILDLIMPRMDGEETFRALKRFDPSVRILVASGFSRGDKVAELMDEGALGFLEKPFDYEQFSKMVVQLVRE